MSIGFRFTAKVRRKELLIEAVQKLVKEEGYRVAVGDEGLRVYLCPMGELWMGWEKESGLLGQWAVSGECISTPAGAGLHKAAIGIVDNLNGGLLRKLSMEDETDYFDHRDFDRMKTEHFYPWLGSLLSLCRDQLTKDEHSNLCLCWDLDQYQPAEILGTVITPLGRFSIAHMAEQVNQKGLKWFADRFFLWDKPEKDARYHRNCALNLLWEKCWFAPSSRSDEDAACNGDILKELELAARLNPTLPLPMDAYREVCALADKEPAIPDSTPVLESDLPIGYRKGEITISVSELRLNLPGRYRYEWEEWENGRGCDLWCDSSTQSPIWRVNGYRRDEGDAEFSDHLNGLQDLEEIQLKKGAARWGWHFVADENEPYYQVLCEAIVGPALFLVTVTYEHPEQREGIYRQLCKLNVIPKNQVQNRTETYNGDK